MAIDLQWYDAERTIIYAQFPPKWVWDDVYALLDEVNRMMDDVTHPVDVIYDMLKSYSLFPPSALPNLQRLSDTAHPNDRLVIFISNTTFVKMIVEIAHKFSPRQEPIAVRYVASLEDALAHIAAYRDTPDT
jgi:hypothetical protein